MKDFGREHFADILLACLSMFFAGLAVLCMYMKMEKLGELFGTVSGGNLIGALVMRLRSNTDPAIMSLIKSGSADRPPNQAPGQPADTGPSTQIH